MNDRLDELCTSITPRELSYAGDDIAIDFCLPEDKYERILSGTLKKAGIDMKENKISVKGNKNRIAAIAVIAAAAMLTVTAGAKIYSKSISHEKVVESMVGGEGAYKKLDEKGTVSQNSAELEHLKISQDVAYFTDRFAYAVVIVEPTDDKGIELINKGGFNLDCWGDDTVDGRWTLSYAEDNSYIAYRIVYGFSGEEDIESYSQECTLTSHDRSVRYGSIALSFDKKLDGRVFVNEKGEEAILYDIGFAHEKYIREFDHLPDDLEAVIISIDYPDGTKREIKCKELTGAINSSGIEIDLFKNTFTDFENVSGFEAGGEYYTPKQ